MIEIVPSGARASAKARIPSAWMPSSFVTRISMSAPHVPPDEADEPNRVAHRMDVAPGRVVERGNRRLADPKSRPRRPDQEFRLVLETPALRPHGAQHGRP